MVVENVLESLGDDSVTHQEAAHQLIYDVLVEPIELLNLRTTLVDRTTFETHQMRLYAHE